MSSRISHAAASPGAVQALISPGRYLAESGLEPMLLDLMSYRASQINGCAYCVNMHANALRNHGEREQRLYLLDTWRETTLYTDRERAALAWTEAVTRLDNREVPDDVYEEALRHFGEKGLVDLTLAVAMTNAWNRLNVSFRTDLGPFRVRKPEHGDQ